MKVLAISDQVVPQLYGPGIQARFAGVDLVLACGDLPRYYLEYVVTMLNVPLMYVMGNHGYELEYTSAGQRWLLPAGCLDLDGRAIEYEGLLLAGLGGSMRYKEGPHQYTQEEMNRRVLRLEARLLIYRALRRRWLDVLITHAPPLGIHDGQDLCHTGFRAFLRFMEVCRPQYLIHGHSHVLNRMQTATTTCYRNTVVANAYPYRVLDVRVPGAP